MNYHNDDSATMTDIDNSAAAGNRPEMRNADLATQVSNRDLLQAQDLLATAQRSYMQALVRYNVALVKLLAVEETLLQNLGVQ